MADDGTPGLAEAEPAEETQTKPVKLRRTRLPKGAWNGILRRTMRGFKRDNLTDIAAALTYYGVLSIFPGLLVLVSALRIFGADTSSTIIQNVVAIAPGGVGNTLENAVSTLQQSSQNSARIVIIVGIAGALWSASGFVGAFMRASNRIYDVPEGRPFWKIAPIRILLTVSTGVILTAASLSIVLTGKLASAIGDAAGVGHQAVSVWNIAKWPVLLIIISLLFALLYWASPNARTGRFRWISAGSLVAVLLWLIASVGFAFYVANFASYNRVYGSLATVIVFLVWLWISNLALLFGAELDSEVQRERAIAAGRPADEEPYLPLRDTTALTEELPEAARP